MTSITTNDNGNHFYRISISRKKATISFDKSGDGENFSKLMTFRFTRFYPDKATSKPIAALFQVPGKQQFIYVGGSSIRRLTLVSDEEVAELRCHVLGTDVNYPIVVGKMNVYLIDIKKCCSSDIAFNPYSSFYGTIKYSSFRVKQMHKCDFF